MSLKSLLTVRSLAALAIAATLASASRAEVIVNQFQTLPASPGDNKWYFTGMQAGGQATIVDLAGGGGNLENNQPLPTGAALLTTDNDNNSRAEVGTFADFGDATSVLSNIQLGYEYYKANVGNQFAAPALKLEIYNPGGTGDNYGHLIYEPSWNQPVAGSQLVPTGDWQAVSINSNTGSGGDGDASGGWWWSGGFNVSSGAGGPPLRSLSEWVGTFQFSDPSDFADARVTGIRMGVGTYNQDQIGYFDKVSYAITGGPGETFNFQAVPEPASAALLGLAALVLTGVRCRK